jgi:polar amino acid transport system substrate-binding protein
MALLMSHVAKSICLTALLAASALATAESILVLTEETPFTKTDINDKSGGEATDFVRAVLEHAQIDYQLQYLPWRRTYSRALNEPEILIYPLARSPDRENDFHWIGRLIPVNYYLFKQKTRTDISVTDLDKAKPYRIGVVNYFVQHEYLTAKGFTNLQPVNRNLQNVRKLLLGRIDLFPISEGGLISICERHNIDCNQFQPVIKLQGISDYLYLAFGPDSDPELVRRARASFQALKDSGLHSTIFARRLELTDRFNLQHIPSAD